VKNAQEKKLFQEGVNCYHGEKLVIDLTTGLTWQQSGSLGWLNYSNAEKYIRGLNNKLFAGWRLLTQVRHEKNFSRRSGTGKNRFRA
jgi:hypothetical protein